MAAKAKKAENEREREQHLKEAQAIWFHHQDDRDLCVSKMRVKHLRALLVSLGKTKEIKGLKKDALVSMYWTVHRNVSAVPEDVDSVDGVEITVG